MLMAIIHSNAVLSFEVIISTLHDAARCYLSHHLLDVLAQRGHSKYLAAPLSATEGTGP